MRKKNLQYLSIVYVLRFLLFNILMVHTVFAQDTPAVVNVAPPDGYKILRGRIGKYPVTMRITDFGRYYSGSYYYNKYREPIYIMSTTSPVQDKRPTFDLIEGPGKYFRGEMRNGSYSGMWLDSFKTLPFLLRECYREGDVRLIPYCYFYTLHKPNRNRFHVALDMYLADPANMPAENAVELNRLLFGMLEQQAGISPDNVFERFKRITLDTMSEDVFNGLEGTYFSVEQKMAETHNENGILCIRLYASYNPKQSILNRMQRFLIYDSEENRRLTQRDIFNCSDSVLRSIVIDKFRESYSDQQIEEILGTFDKWYTGDLSLSEGMFYFNFQPVSHNWNYSIRMPFKDMKKYIRPEYRAKLY